MVDLMLGYWLSTFSEHLVCSPSLLDFGKKKKKQKKRALLHNPLGWRLIKQELNFLYTKRSLIIVLMTLL